MRAIKEFTLMVLILCVLFGGVLFLFDTVMHLAWRFMSR